MKFTQLDEDAKFIIQSTGQKIKDKPWQNIEIKNLSLNPYRPFKEILRNAKHVVFASGTLKPLEDFYYLKSFSQQSSFEELKQVDETDEEVGTFSCGHIIDDTQLKCITVSKFTKEDGSSGIFNFQFKNRRNIEQVKGLAKYILDLTKSIVETDPNPTDK